MKIYQLSQKGNHHVNYNEDYVIYSEIGKNRLMLAVLDGCTMGKESYFASTLIGKLLRKESKKYYYKEFYDSSISIDLSEQIDQLMEDLFVDLQEIKNVLQLEIEELLSTLVLGIVDTETSEGELIVIGDGVVMINGELIDFDQGNRPDYLGYHLRTDFSTWYEKQNQRISMESIKDISLCSDGIFTFGKYDLGNYAAIEESSLISYLLEDRSYETKSNMLYRKLLEISETWGLEPRDDISILRLILNS